ncbi:unnamed protein product [Sphagnum troendelagicum]|uniref:Uncharacterized protein n=1 Tax=Sphagnum jensenii TaxID=128206 RepID=A0ABP0WXI5_9BRYO
MGCSKSFKELLHIRNAADPWMCVVLSMDNRVKGWCAEDEPCSSSSSSTKKQTAQTLPAKMLFLSHLFEFVLGSTLHYVGWLGSAEGAWVVVQITLHV